MRTAAKGGGSSAEVARLNRTKQTNSFALKLGGAAHAHAPHYAVAIPRPLSGAVKIEGL